MAVRERLGGVVLKRVLEEVVTAESTAENVEPSDADVEKCSSAQVPVTKRKMITRRQQLKCSVSSCDESFGKMKKLIEHLNEAHDQNVKVQRLVFSSEAEFVEWLNNIQRSELCNFLRRNLQKTSSTVRSYYYCTRSGSSRTMTEPRKRQLKVQGSIKINRTCPAHIIKHVKQGGIAVDYCAKHLCFTNAHEQLDHVRLLAADRAWLAGKMALEIPMDAILRDVRKTFDGPLTRLHNVKKTDLFNIEQAFCLKKRNTTMLNVRMKPKKTRAAVRMQKPKKTRVAVRMQNSADSDNGDNDHLEIDIPDEIHVRLESEAAAHMQQLSRPKTKFEERLKKSEKYLMETIQIMKSLKTEEECDVFDSGLCGIKARLTAVRAKNATTSLVRNSERYREPSDNHVEKQRRFFSTKRRAEVASSGALSKPSNEERNKIELKFLKANLVNNASGTASKQNCI